MACLEGQQPRPAHYHQLQSAERADYALKSFWGISGTVLMALLEVFYPIEKEHIALL
jgi:hypothetical protein